MSGIRTHRRLVPAAVAALALSAGLAACSSSGSSTTSSGTGAATSSAATASSGVSAAAAGMDFGSGCSAVPTSGSGSFTGMAQDPVATAASNNPALSTLVSAVKAAGLVDTLNNAQNITVFAPANAAFEKIPSSTLNSVLANKAELTKILTYHVVSGRLSPSELAGTHKTLEGSDLTVSGSGESFTVTGGSSSNTANVVCGDVQTANATVYIIDTVLMPAS
ncbi:fasciclin domain-containing protein [Actinospica sp. MGRD01-02]|uniref:Fasciclin domain-containing protein n=1 Tax=Actinospica acidithermotolerans TaxID=2828514 RepID=A0A941IMD8_9ACTN|nr:fasciclin domain-containing protein [Actinospica acidithermotolerans]MBR7828476.1 fasciclin domain-containing protein [Actinospica acidithermotolerans]